MNSARIPSTSEILPPYQKEVGSASYRSLFTVRKFKRNNEVQEHNHKCV